MDLNFQSIHILNTSIEREKPPSFHDIFEKILILKFDTRNEAQRSPFPPQEVTLKEALTKALTFN